MTFVEMVKSSIPSRNLLLFFLVAIIACASVCKKPQTNENYLEPINVSNSPGSAWYEPSIIIDSKGNIHLVWTEDSTGVCDNEQIFYATKPAGGNWSVPVNILESTFLLSDFGC